MNIHGPSYLMEKYKMSYGASSDPSFLYKFISRELSFPSSTTRHIHDKL